MNGPWGYDLRPQEIENKSFEIIAELADLSRFSPAETALVKRVIHATGDPSFVDLVAWSPDAIAAAADALRRGAPIVTDVNMVRAGISQQRLARFGFSVHCSIADPEIAEEARSRGLTRSIVAVEKAVRAHPDAVFAFGNAPTALFRLLELVDTGEARPAASGIETSLTVFHRETRPSTPYGLRAKSQKCHPSYQTREVIGNAR